MPPVFAVFLTAFRQCVTAFSQCLLASFAVITPRYSSNAHVPPTELSWRALQVPDDHPFVTNKVCVILTTEEQAMDSDTLDEYDVGFVNARLDH